MKIKCPIEHFIVILKDMVGDVDVLMNQDAEEKDILKWKDLAVAKLSRMLGDDHAYVVNFDAINFGEPEIAGADEILLEEAFRLGLEDARSFLVALIDEIESECRSTPGLMDMESVFAEMNRYVSIKVDDPLIKDSLYQRVTRLRDGMLTGEISSAELQNHVKQISYLDSGLFERIVPLLAWYYIDRDPEPGAYSN